MRLQFTKMHGLGNDFVVLDGVSQHLELAPAQIRAIADRRFGVGCDQLLLVEKPISADVDFRYRIFNADGQEVEQCGNGARCFARFVRARGLTTKHEIVVETANGVIRLKVLDDDQVTVDMGKPRLEPAAIPFIAEIQAERYSIRVDDKTLEIGAVSMGNPHAVLIVDDVDRAPVATLGPLLERHPRFPKRVNVGFMEVVAPDHIRLRVFERGVGETLACGSGACAALVCGRVQGLLDKAVRADLRGGSLRLCWGSDNETVTMTGPASFVFEGGIDL